jgi:lantibiotic transport system permease protein
MAIVRALGAEWIKLKRTLALWLTLIAPLVIVALQLAMVIEREEYYRQRGVQDAWGEYGQQTVFLWALLMLPLFITLETALTSHLEHGNQGWKHLFALPIPRGAIYAAKQVSGMALIGLSMAALFLYLVLSGLGLRVLTPGLGFEAPVPWVELAQYVAAAYLASWLILSLHTWVGLRWPSFVVACAAGIAAMVVAVILFQSDWSQWYPWTLPGLVTYRLGEGEKALAELLAGSIGGLAVAVVGGWEVTRRDVL